MDSQKDHRVIRGGTPPWIQERIVTESKIVRNAEVLGLPVPPRPGTRAHDRAIVSLLNRIHLRQADKDEPDIPF